MMESFTYQSRLLRVIRAASPQPAEVSGAASCQRSGVCCWRRPCELHPGDVERLAAHLGLTPQETFAQYLRVDVLDRRLVLLPRRVSQGGGTFVTVTESWDLETPCVFLRPDEQNACSVQAAKPTGGAHWNCAMTKDQVAALPVALWTIEALMALGWDGDDEA